MMEEARKLLEEDGFTDEHERIPAVPIFALQMVFPKLPGQTQRNMWGLNQGRRKQGRHGMWRWRYTTSRYSLDSSKRIKK